MQSRQHNFRNHRGGARSPYPRRNDGDRRHDNKWNGNNKFHERNNSENSSKTNFIDYPIVRKSLIDYVYNTIAIAKYKFRLIHNQEDLNTIEKNHHVGYSYHGTSCFLVFTRQKDKYYSLLINRNTLSYSRDQVDDLAVKITPVELRVNQDMYRGTIFDGTLLRYQDGRPKTFIINDVFQLNGESRLVEKIHYKQLHLKTYLAHMITEDKRLNNIEIILNEFLPLNKIRDIYKNRDGSQYKSDINGFTFLPEYSGNKCIYLFPELAVKSNDDKSNKPIMKNDNKTNDNKSVKHVTKNNTDIKIIFEMRKTGIPDVHDLYLFDSVKGKTMELKKISTAYIPTAECSLFCRDVLKDKDAVVVCQYVPEKDRWVPLNEEPYQNYPETTKVLKRYFAG